MTPAELLADSLACHRLTRLVAADVITQPLRDRVLAWAWRDRAGEVVDALRPSDPWPSPVQLRHLPAGSIQQAMEEETLTDPPKLATLITCRWCAGVYVAAAVTVLSAARVPGWRWASRGLACASAAALWASLEDR
jgi:hypothetical protein